MVDNPSRQFDQLAAGRSGSDAGIADVARAPPGLDVGGVGGRPAGQGRSGEIVGEVGQKREGQLAENRGTIADRQPVQRIPDATPPQ